MNKNKLSTKMVATKNKNKVISCSTPEHRADSPSRDSDSICDSEAASPVPFLCTQDGVEGDTDVVWNYYTPKSEQTVISRSKNSTPLGRKAKKYIRPKVIEKEIPKRRPIKIPHKQSELFQELVELNQKLPELLAHKTQKCVIEQTQSVSEDDNIFSTSPECSPKTGLRNSSLCLRKNVLSSKFSKPEPEAALESDDSMNECLLKASQMVEEKYVCAPSSPKRVRYESPITNRKNLKSNNNLKMDQDSMDAILNSIKLESPAINRARTYDSPKLSNDSFDSFVGNLNDSALEQLTQMPIKSEASSKKLMFKIQEEPSDWKLEELVVHDGSPSSKIIFGRHNSMPESPSIVDSNKPSTSGMVFGRYNSMPYDKNADDYPATGDSPIRCTPEEIKRKHKLAREKLLAKRQLPFTSSQSSTQSAPELNTRNSKKNKFQPRIPSSANNEARANVNSSQKSNENQLDLKLLIEKKRQEALIKLRRRQPK